MAIRHIPAPSTFAEYEARYVHPDGSNLNPGTQSAPMKTVSYADADLSDTAGALFVCTGSKWSDGTEGLGLEDNAQCLLAGSLSEAALPPGWRPTRHRIWRGWGPDQATSFGFPAAQLSWGLSESTDRTKPSFWLAASPNAVDMANLIFTGQQPMRFGWMYRYNADKTIAWANITSAERGDGISVFTVDFPSPFAVTQMSRSSNVVTARVTMPDCSPSFPGTTGSWVLIDSGSGAGTFGDGQFQVTGVVTISSGVYDITYAEAGADQATTARTGASAAGHFCGADDFIEVQSDNAEWPTTMYRVTTGVTATTIPCVDTSGGWGGRAATVAATPNVGRYVLQCRQVDYLLANLKMNNVCSFPTGALPGRFNFGPVWDFGTCISEWVWLTSCVTTGPNALDGSELMIRDLDRGAAMLFAGGKAGASGAVIRDQRLSDGNIRCFASSVTSWGLFVDDCLQDSGTGLIRPTVQLVTGAAGSGPATLRFKDIHMADASDADGDPGGPSALDLGGVTGSIEITNCDNVRSARTPSTAAYAFVTGERLTNVLSYDARGLTGVHGRSGRLYGRRIDAQAQFGVVQKADYVNRVNPDLSTWATFGTATVTGGIETDALDGMGGAYRIDGGGGGSTSAWLQPASFSPALPSSAAGDHVIYGMWCRNPSGSMINTNDSIFQFGFLSPLSLLCNYRSADPNDGEWQWCADIGVVTAADAGRSDFFLKLDSTAAFDLDVKYATMLYLPASTYTPNAAYQILQTFRPFPAYLQKGMAGTAAGQKLIAHGGLGTAKRYTVGAGSGQITIGAAASQAVEVFDESGNSLGVIRPNAFTVNP